MQEKESSKRKYNRLPETTWVEIETLWQDGCVTLEELADRFDVSRRTLQSRFARKNIEKGSKAALLAETLRERVAETYASTAVDLAERARQTRDRAFRSADLIEELLLGQLEIVRLDPSQAPKIAAVAKGLSLAAATLERVHTIKAKALGMDKEETVGMELPTLVFADLTEKDITRMRKEQEDAEDDGQLIANADSVPAPHPARYDVDESTQWDDEIVEEIDDPYVDEDGCRLVGHRRN